MASASGFDYSQLERVPKLVVFDLDDTLWSPEMWLCAGAPFSTCAKTGRVFDARKTEIRLIGDTHAILHDLHTHEAFKETQIGYASRTEYTDWAEECLKRITINNTPKSLLDISAFREIYPTDKTKHFKEMKRAAESVDFHEMLFFDNEYRNVADVQALGVCSVHCPDGMTHDIFLQGLKAFAAGEHLGARKEKKKKM